MGRRNRTNLQAQAQANQLSTTRVGSRSSSRKTRSLRQARETAELEAALEAYEEEIRELGPLPGNSSSKYRRCLRCGQDTDWVVVGFPVCKADARDFDPERDGEGWVIDYFLRP